MGFRQALRAVVLTVAAAPSLAAPAAASFPGQNGKIAFTQVTEIYSVDPDGSGPVNLTNNSATDVGPVWTPDGKDVAFSTNRGGTFQLYSMKPEGSSPTLLCPNSTSGFDWSPDGQRLVWVGGNGLEIVGPNDIRTTRYCERHPLVSGDASEPSWSPDGSRIAYVLYNSPDHDIHVINVDGTGDVQLTSGPPQQTSPDWSPDGTRIAFTVGSGTAPGIYTMNADGSNVTPVPGTAADSEPDWSPDGTRLAVQHYTGVDFQDDIDTIALDGSGRIMVAGGSSWQAEPDWQQVVAVTGFPRPKGATPLDISLVVAYDGCFAPNRGHGPPLAGDSCSPPKQASDNLTVGTLDSNGQRANFAGSVRFDVAKGDPGTPADEADVRLRVNLKDVRCKAAISPCTGGALSEASSGARSCRA
jgi:dipeptidyl aminopeptidase/acylaminoacyl peptidase